MVPEDLFVSKTLLKLIAQSKDSSDEIYKSVSADIPELSNKDFEETSETEVVVPVVDPPPTESSEITVDTSSLGKSLTIITDLHSPDIVIPDEKVLYNIFSNIRISSVVTQIKTEQKISTSNLEDLKKVTLTDLRDLTKKSDLFLKLETIKK